MRFTSLSIQIVKTFNHAMSFHAAAQTRSSRERRERLCLCSTISVKELVRLRLSHKSDLTDRWIVVSLQDLSVSFGLDRLRGLERAFVQ